MGSVWVDMRRSLVLGLLGPILVVGAAGRLLAVGEAPSFSASLIDSGISVPVLREEGTEEMALDDYLRHVLLGEMPASFEPEALKAQAVAARTYTIRALTTGGKHDGALCTDSACCQAYCAQEVYESQPPETLEKIRLAVSETDGLVLSYEGALIEATFFSGSGGRTEDAVAVWGVDYPYLRAVDSPGETGSPHDRDSFYFTRQTLEHILGISLEEGCFLGEASFTSGGGVERLTLGEHSFSGVYLRRALGLPSTAFTATVEGDGLRFDTRGYGHRVGLSQYGANAMAARGSSFREILSHYYTGTTLLNYGEFVEKRNEIW